MYTSVEYLEFVECTLYIIVKYRETIDYVFYSPYNE